ncbi:glyceraldehyde-3-phosphate dehydrogenase [Exilibacterium tricleocarpae]|uniref:Glyceraldehyde-3-phosphate dehydrogenase n=1 Tax=Exilibacterium tricleocarpae TaxID=2591008 RepID=A0A545U881_9GAMM|nr:glyceraldehyde 3-phosphate dehydrogenase NAD-binding domain-containing protein [Exilibacterium tricleocarpae]TQV85680.1 glyceraldehyde-3-phosphate dehydrogenase [Exilibacterium tricleocarpae]
MATQKIRLGIMGFGHIGRHLYRLALEGDDIEIVAVCDIGKPEIIHYLLETEGVEGLDCTLDGNYLRNPKFSTRILNGSHPSDVPWDLFEVDFVIDATRKYDGRDDMQAHLDAGAKRVIIAMLPKDHIDRFVIPGINDDTIKAGDRMICAGSATTGALATVLNAVDRANLKVDYAIMTSVHAYTSDQSLQDAAGEDYRRSRSAAENIIPNTNLSPAWVEKIMPQFAGRLCGNALNVPVQKGSMLDCTIIFKDPAVTVEDVNTAIVKGAEQTPNLLAATAEPIVSSDVIGCRQSALFDLKATIKSGQKMVKTIAWYESVGHACRIIDVVRAYADLEQANLEKGE